MVHDDSAGAIQIQREKLFGILSSFVELSEYKRFGTLRVMVQSWHH